MERCQHLSLTQLKELRLITEQRWHTLHDQYRDAYMEWAVVMNAIKNIKETYGNV